MRTRSRLGLALAATVLVGLTPTARAKAIAIAVPQTPAAQAANADAVVVGTVTEVGAEPVEVTAFPGAPKDAKMSFKVAVVKVDTALMGAGGVTRFRVGFPSDAPVAGGAPGEPVRPGGPVPIGGRGRRPGRVTTVALTAGMEGCFVLTRHHEGDFYTLVGPPLLKKADDYAKELDRVKVVVKAIDDPVTALKAKDMESRFRAAQAILQRYQTARGLRPGRPPAREPIPEEENKLLVALLKELPWMPKVPPDGGPEAAAPSRSALWYLANPAESGYKDPVIPAQPAGAPPVDYNKIMDDATTKFLTESADKIKIKRFVSK